ncbi:MAG: MFS transporter [Candidatus Bathyarchaeota archaeon]|nr:MFS transporter [Candidatus Bathyarchaeota archaeon]
MEAQQKRNGRLALLGAAHSFNHSLFVIAPPLLSLIMADLGVAKSEIGLVSMIASFIYGAGSLVGGPLGDKIGETKTIVICLSISGLSTYVMLAAWATRTIYIYALGLILMAVWASLYHPTANSFIYKAFRGRVAEAMGLHGVGGTLGVVLTPTVAWFIGASYGWPWAFVAFGTLSFLLALFFADKYMRVRLGSFILCLVSFAFFCFELLQYRLFTAVILSWVLSLCFIILLRSFRGERQVFREDKRVNGGSIFDALKIRELWVLLLFNVAIGLFMKGIELFFPTYLKENRGIDPMWASVAYTLVLATGVPAQWIGGKAADLVGSKKVLIATSLGVCVSLLALLLTPLYIVGIGIFIFIYGLSFYAHQPALNALTGFLSPQNQRGAVYGIFFFTSFGIGSLSQSIAGFIGDIYGLDMSFYILTVFAFIALLLSLKLPEKREDKEKATASPFEEA